MALSKWLVVIALAGCEKQGEAPADEDIERMMADMATYAEKSLPILAKFDGDCGKIADQLLTLEPLAKTIRTRGAGVEADEPRKQRFAARRMELKDSMTKRFEGIAKGLGMTMEDIDHKEAEVKAKCASDPKFIDAQERVGLMKKKSK